MSEPKVSIIIPCYNAEKWIEKCLLSALHQNYGNLEVVFVDNESTDGSMKIVKDIKKAYKNLIIEQAKNIYPRCWDEPRSKGFEVATGQYFFTLASDDMYEADYVSNVMIYIMSAPDKIKAFQSSVRSIDQEGNLLPQDYTTHMYKTLSEFKNLCLSGCPVASPSVVYNRQLYDDGLLDTSPELYSGAADYDLYCRLADSGIFIYPAGRYLGYNYRWHPEQATWKMHKDPINYDKLIQDYWRQKWNQ